MRTFSGALHTSQSALGGLVRAGTFDSSSDTTEIDS